MLRAQITRFALFSPLTLTHFYPQIIHDVRPDFSLCREKKKKEKTSSNHRGISVAKRPYELCPCCKVDFRVVVVCCWCCCVCYSRTHTHTSSFSSVYSFNIYKHGLMFIENRFYHGELRSSTHHPLPNSLFIYFFIPRTRYGCIM